MTKRIYEPVPCTPWPLRLLIWLAICLVSAAPSFYFGYGLFSERQFAIAMLLGIGIFVAGYTWVTGTPTIRRLKARPFFMRTTFRIGYGTRLFISIIFPIALFVDMFCGILSTSIVGAMMGEGDTFVGVLAITLVQGLVLNLVLVLYMSLVHGIQCIFRKRPLETACVACGYDLRMTADRCPECGRDVPLPQAA